MPKPVRFKALAGYSKLSDVDVVTSGIAVQTNMTGNSKFPNPPVDLATLKTNVDSLTELMAEAADGSRKVIARRNQQREVVTGMLRLLARYVENVSVNDPTAFETSGFQLASRPKAQPAPLSEKIRKIDHGSNSGQMLVWLQPVPRAGSYELHYGPAVNAGAPANWTTQGVLLVKSPTVLTGLTPGATYFFQARALLKDGFTDWSNPVTFICT